MKYSLYTVNGKDFRGQVNELLKKCISEKNIVRLVFWGSSQNNVEYVRQRLEISRQVSEYFGECCPSFSYVAQRPLEGGLAMEVQAVDVLFQGNIFYRENRGLPYVIIEGSGYRELFAGGMGGKNVNEEVGIQAEEAMEQMKELLEKEGFAIDEIVRQWNYLERITEFDGDHQRYQDFNEVRSAYYATALWGKGYPAATGIGTQWGGVLIDWIALKTEKNNCLCVPLDNELQIAAHVYSQQVLSGKREGDGKKTTPKFERAKVVVSEHDRIIYISGTAAIRGEKSLTGVCVQKQTETTLENIDFLISEHNLQKAGIAGRGELQMIRVYLKHPGDLMPVKEYVQQRLGRLPVLYLLADVCREELLVEVEGVAKVVK